MTRRPFGTLPDGTPVEALTISGGGLTAEVLTWGAVVRDLRLEGHAPPLVLGFERLEDYLAHSRNHGATVGRFAGRIAAGRYTLDGAPVQLEVNETKRGNSLHGGAEGIGKRVWQVESLGTDRLTLSIRDPDGQGGFPGTVDVLCHILLKDGTLRIAYESRTDTPGPVNIAHHSYFNLDGSTDILTHRVRIDAGHYLPPGPGNAPTGEIAPVAGTPFDLQALTAIGPQMAEGGVAFDHCFCLSRTPEPLRRVARVESPGGMALDVATTEPGLVFFAAVPIDVPVPGLEGRRYGPSAGLCLEAQLWPDAVNHPEFPDCVLRPGQVRVQETHYSFARL